ncbi:hypothetical protein BaRGS_00002690 [Batillaria attramentaria]|uniref:Uncharacterized protein n=1 Tax=Batillaria attramentaria TaxID=370345 RepID=A0ABD0M3Y6_9CAEN
MYEVVTKSFHHFLNWRLAGRPSPRLPSYHSPEGDRETPCLRPQQDWGQGMKDRHRKWETGTGIDSGTTLVRGIIRQCLVPRSVGGYYFTLGSQIKRVWIRGC